MRRVIVFALLMGLCPGTELFCDLPVPYRVSFTNKGPDPCTVGTPLYTATLAEFSSAALERRARHGIVPPIDILDAPLYAPYLDSLRTYGVQPRTMVRWRNCTIVTADSLLAERIGALPFVASIQRVSQHYYPVTAALDCRVANHGLSKPFIDLLNIGPLHRAGVYGHGVRLGVLDNGFELGTHPTMKHVDVAGAYDVIYDDDDVSNDEFDPIAQSGHGSLVLSVMAGYANGAYIGVSPFAEYYLCKSEDMRYERRDEEDNMCIGIEWLERNGVEVVNMSVGYMFFDASQDNNTLSDLTGSHTFAARAVNRATALGMTCVVAAGNLGPTPNLFITPGDADSAISVGALATRDTLAPFSSYGLTAIGKVKPDVVSYGVQVASADGTSNNYVFTEGTSIASPQIAGAMTLLRQLRPDATAYELRSALFATASIPSGGNQMFGHGIPDITAAARHLGPCMGPPSVVISDNRYTVLVHVFTSDASATNVDVCFVNAERADTLRFAMGHVDGNVWSFPIPETGLQDYYGAFFEARLGSVVRRTPYRGSYTMRTDSIVIPCGFDIPAVITSVEMPVVDEGTHAMRVYRNGDIIRTDVPVQCTSVDGRAVSIEHEYPAAMLSAGMYVLIGTRTASKQCILVLP